MLRFASLALCVMTAACFTQDLPTAPRPAPQLIAKPGLAIALDRNNPLLVRGMVVSDSGVPLVGANVTIDAINASVGTDKSGAFVIKTNREGTFLVRVRAIGYTPATQTVTIGAGAGLWVNATLKADAMGMACNLVITGTGVGIRP
jgi:hypothetical protein